MKRLLLLTLALAGCAPMQKPVASVPPATTACVADSAIPPEPPMVGQKFNGDAKHDLQILAPNALALRQWGEQLHAMLEGCAKPASPPAAIQAK